MSQPSAQLAFGRTREAHEACWEFLQIEMIEWVNQQQQEKLRRNVSALDLGGDQSQPQVQQSQQQSQQQPQIGNKDSNNNNPPSHSRTSSINIKDDGGHMEPPASTDSTLDVTLAGNNNNTLADECEAKLELIGFNVGQRLAERYTRERPRFQDTLEIIKFLCKEFWMEIFKKQIDNLRTNHRGIYVLHDNRFRWLAKLSAGNNAQAKEAAAKYLIFPCGLMRGALANLGLVCEVSAEVTTLPGCNFTVKIKT